MTDCARASELGRQLSGWIAQQPPHVQAKARAAVEALRAVLADAENLERLIGRGDGDLAAAARYARFVGAVFAVAELLIAGVRPLPK